MCIWYKNKSLTNIYMPVYICKNCGNVGHLYKDCPQPIISSGVICYHKDIDGELYYLMIQRKDSLAFMEFIKGKYEPNDESYLKHLFSGMTYSEKEHLKKNQDFDIVWKAVWSQSNNKNTKEYIDSKTHYEELIKTNKLNTILQTALTHYQEPEWGFPKGRKKLQETYETCSLREFHEETEFKEEDIEIQKNIGQFTEIFFGTNNVLYKHIYQIAKFVGIDQTVNFNPQNTQQIREIRAIKWVKYNEVLNHLRQYNNERIKLFKQVHKTIISLA